MGWTKGKPRKKKAVEDTVEATSPIAEETGDITGNAFTIEMEEAPDDTFPEPEPEQGFLKNILGQLGLQGSEASSTAVRKQPATKLNAKQRQFCETFTPLASGVLVLSLTWGYSRINEVYAVLAPSQEVATNIVAPLVRIYARQAKFVNSVNPNYIDAAASLTAFIGYVMTTYQMYRQIKAGAWDEQESTNEQQSNTPYDIAYARESRSSGASHRRENFSESTTGPVPSVPVSTRNNADHDIRLNLTDAERYQFEKLSILRERDIASRARRSGRYGGVRSSAS